MGGWQPGAVLSPWTYAPHSPGPPPPSSITRGPHSALPDYLIGVRASRFMPLLPPGLAAPGLRAESKLLARFYSAPCSPYGLSAPDSIGTARFTGLAESAAR